MMLMKMKIINLFKRKPKCQRKKGKHEFDYNLHCIYCGISVVDLDREYYRKNREMISKILFDSIKRDKDDYLQLTP